MADPNQDLVKEMHRLAYVETKYVDVLSMSSDKQDRALLESEPDLKIDVGSLYISISMLA